MGWSVTIGRLFGIPVKIHATLIILLGVLALMTASAGAGPVGLMLVVLLFASVLVHELGHALVARRYGVQTREIVLLPIGGAALLTENPRTAGHEFWIALAGPLVSLALAGVSWLGLQLLSLHVLADLFIINLLLGLFNLVPAFPLDGGRVLRAGLSRWMGPIRATRMAARIGRLIAIGFIVFGFFHGMVLLAFVGAFVFMAASSEERGTIVHAVIGSRKASDVMERSPTVLGAASSLAEAAEVLRAHESTKALPVAFGERVLGVVHREQVLAAAGRDTDASLSEVLDRNVVHHDGQGSLLALLQEMGQRRSRAAVLGVGGDIQGVVVIERVLEEIRAARHSEF